MGRTTEQLVRSSVSGARPATNSYNPGTLYVNFADWQLGVMDASKQPQDLIAVRFFKTTAAYAAGAFVVHNGELYKANGAVAAGAFNAAQWTKWVSGTITGFLVTASNLSDVPDKAQARTNLGLGSLATKSSVSATTEVTGLGTLALKNSVSAATEVTGLAASATTDTTNAANIASGVLGSARGGAGTVNGIMKANGSGTTSAATAGTDYMKPDTTSAITKGFTITSANLGNKNAAFTVDVTLGNYQYYSNTGAHTVTFPTTSDFAVELLVTNATGAGAITISGSTVMPGSDTPTTTVGSRFLLGVRRIGGVTYHSWKALQ